MRAAYRCSNVVDIVENEHETYNPLRVDICLSVTIHSLSCSVAPTLHKTEYGLLRG